MLRRFIKRILFISTIAVLISSCKKDEITTDPSAHLQFSQDTVMFDTVFVQTGSSTQLFTVKNNNKQPVSIASIRLGNGNSSFFRLNVNGTPGKSFTNVEIDGNDSIYIFVEVTIPDPNSPNTPFIVSDSIIFELNGNVQYVQLVAFGQRAHFHHAAPNSGSLFFVDCNDTWTNDLPHVVYGYALVDSGCTLTIQQGAEVHFHPGSGMIVLSEGTLKVNGTLSSPVTFEGDRLDYSYHDVPGQWNGILLSNITRRKLIYGIDGIGPGTVNSSMNYAIIKNGDVGLEVDTSFAPGQTTLELDNSIIKNMSGVGLLAKGASVKVNNCEFSNSGQYLAAMLYGGNYRFLHRTFANFWEQSTPRQTPSIYINNYYIGIRPLDSAYFGNCIVYGNVDAEVGLDSANSNAPGIFNYYFDHCLLKVDGSVPTSSSSHFRSIINQDPQFNDPTNFDYQLGPGSPAINAGDSNITNLSSILNFDLKGNPRPSPSNPQPDLGAYEKQ